MGGAALLLLFGYSSGSAPAGVGGGWAEAVIAYAAGAMQVTTYVPGGQKVETFIPGAEGVN